MFDWCLELLLSIRSCLFFLTVDSFIQHPDSWTDAVAFLKQIKNDENCFGRNYQFNQKLYNPYFSH